MQQQQQTNKDVFTFRKNELTENEKFDNTETFIDFWIHCFRWLGLTDQKYILLWTPPELVLVLWWTAK